ncbi:ATP-binding cassette domain-containing protein [Lyngbya confervoides]|uniref:ATP-binding cassette domain-containing protein n=1 Tax=Lyngbya confervoides BDU141951 TaxID=1574623 RepID=A0ABD4T5S4_9CYAN|nr:ATP-binding cassette domain-containing protein [Lyngbya confervoides]MCM1983786.1 ATP-binding cassette domain-containing protein [Lyngbya confervoides BDU141951]
MFSIQVNQLVKHYGPVAAVNGIDFTVQPGEIFGLIGPDGAGKTTTFQILAGVMQASAGGVTLLGRSPREARLDVGYLTQGFSLYLDLSILENLRYSAGLRRVAPAQFRTRAQSLLTRMNLDPFRHRLARQLSGGMKQKLALCCALIAQPQVLLLDEPTTGVNPVSRREFWDLLAGVAAEGVTILTATPYLDEAERCHRIALIYAGQIQQMGTLTELKTNLGLHRIELRAEPLDPVETVLQQQAAQPHSALADLQSFGDRLDILTPDVDRATQELQAAQIPITSLELSDPTLENVFVHHLRQQGAAPPYRPFHHYRGSLPRQGLAIAAQELQKNFGPFQAVKQVHLAVKYGEIYGLLGANGAGKTTTIKMLCGLLPPTAGTMSLAGETHNLHRAEVRSRLGYMSQKFTLYDDLTIRQNLEFYCGVYGIPRKLHREKIDWVLETCGLAERDHTLTASLPGGWKQRVAFGASVMHEPDILFLDEPTSGVDPLARRQFWRLIRDFARRGTAILVTTHYLEEAENCNRMAFMVAGEIVAQGTPTQIKASQPGQLLELTTAQTQQASQLLKRQIESWRVSIFGDRLHLVLDHPDQELPPLIQHLQQQQIQIQSQRSIPFTLEDAFIGTVQRTEGKE